VVIAESPLKDVWRRLVWGPFRQAAEAAPPTWEARVVRAMGRAAAQAMPSKLGQVRTNMQRGLGPRADLETLARQTFATHFGNQYIGFLFGKCDARTWPRYLEIQGLHHLEQARAQGRGVVLMHPHMGPAQLPLHVLGVRGYPMHQVGGGQVTEVQFSKTGQWAVQTRASLEQRIQATLHDGGRFLRPILRALENNEIIMSACDGTGGGTELGRRLVRPVLGQPVGVPVGPIWMALQAKAPLLTVRCVRHRRPSGPSGERQDGGEGQALFLAEIGPPVEFERGQGKAAAFESGADAIAAYLSQSLSAWPGDWHFWDYFEPGRLIEGER